ncbi:hypothetical protein ACEWY4_010183 [Coilia grayii]|uniref:Uncharacterized protein n=1 Tax=Coilia grayii TaxID=363190 RepID=A0ABD1K8N9_9TELE
MLKLDLLADVSGLFVSTNSLVNTYRITGQSQSGAARQYGQEPLLVSIFQSLTNSNKRIIKAVRSEAQAFLTASLNMYNQTRTIERALACRTYVQDLFTAARQEIVDLSLRKAPKHVLKDVIEILDLHRWLASDKMKTALLATLKDPTGSKCTGCIGFFATFPLIHLDQVFPNSTTIHSIGVMVKNQVLKWDHLAGYMTVKRAKTLFTTQTCCHETSKYIQHIGENSPRHLCISLVGGHILRRGHKGSRGQDDIVTAAHSAGGLPPEPGSGTDKPGQKDCRDPNQLHHLYSAVCIHMVGVDVPRLCHRQCPQHHPDAVLLLQTPHPVYEKGHRHRTGSKPAPRQHNANSNRQKLTKHNTAREITTIRHVCDLLHQRGTARLQTVR